MPTDRERDAVDLRILTRRALQGDQRAWNTIVDRFSWLVWSIGRSLGLSAADAAEVSQTTWLRLVEHLGRIEDPDRLGAWLVTTTRREALRVRNRRGRVIPTAPEVLERAADEWTLTWDDPVLPADCDPRTVAAAFARLPARSRLLLVMLHCDPPMSYQAISDALEMPIGSIGPTRARALATLRRSLQSTTTPTLSAGD